MLVLITSMVKYCLARIYTLSTPKRELYLVGSTYGEVRSDNAIALYTYLKAEDKAVYFIENRNSGQPDHVKRGSWKSFILFFNRAASFFPIVFPIYFPACIKFPPW
ncbi:hypothetical protein CALK_1559 [Chitinivibrio alkaliphilus ACht1]|uniref:Uncharacterized protein n=2 Tax=Chitinivibrio TaxID=1505231 RepID=U7D4S4_9BACT|nr:hypothetical protein CALK_1559 [Chitinivibrio alkaliphilus ACht1]